MNASTPNSSPKPSFSLAVYCGSKSGVKPEYTQAAQAVGEWIANIGGQLVYGGGRAGLMGTVADACLGMGGRVLGVIPKALRDRELAHTGCTELHVVDTMAERKQMMIVNADAFIALPGGIGTLEEMFEAWTLAVLGYTTKPVGILNLLGFYDGLGAQLGHAQAQGFTVPEQRTWLLEGAEPIDLCERLRAKAAGGV
jgi:uncharacterized protein (TIGR00730 family)